MYSLLFKNSKRIEYSINKNFQISFIYILMMSLVELGHTKFSK